MALILDSKHIHASGIAMDEVVGVIDCKSAVKTCGFMSLANLRQTYHWKTACLALANRTLEKGLRKVLADIPNACMLYSNHRSGSSVDKTLVIKSSTIPARR